MKRTIAEAVERVWDTVTLPNQEQQHGHWRDGGRCCAGSRLAHALGASSGQYLEGADAFAELLGGTRAEVILMLRDAGAGQDPLGTQDWTIPTEQVWKRLSMMERLPPTMGADLRNVNLGGADLTGADLRGADLRETDLSGSVLKGANLQNALATGAQLFGVDLRDATLRMVQMRRTELQGADLRGADLRGANLEETDLENANLRGAKLRAVNLTGARLRRTILPSGRTLDRELMPELHQR